jgi:hypothetical protein
LPIPGRAAPRARRRRTLRPKLKGRPSNRLAKLSRNHCESARSKLGQRCSIQSNKRSPARRRSGESSANSARPSGSIQSPRIGRTLSNPPTMKNAAAGIRAQRDEGLRSQRIVDRIPPGSRSISCTSRQSSDDLVGALVVVAPAVASTAPLKFRRRHTGGSVRMERGGQYE